MSCSMDDDNRYLDNPYLEFEEIKSLQFFGDCVTPPDVDEYRQLKPGCPLELQIKDVCQKLLQMVNDAYFRRGQEDHSVYTGLSGILYLLHGIGSKVEETSIAECVNSSSLKSFLGFLCGISGPLAFAAAYSDNKKRYLKYLLELKDSTIFKESPEEFLYGKAGYLYALLLVKKADPECKEIDSVIQEVISIILHKGSSSSNSETLYYEWYGEEYLGAGHGYAGILSTLLRARPFMNPSQLLMVRSKIDDLMKLQSTSGNFPPSVQSIGNDRLVHWCHGAPGFADLYLLAYDAFMDDKYLKVADLCMDVIWNKGFLKKGFGLCHGSSGNGYVFLLAYKSTRNPKYFYRALRFAEWCCNFENPECSTPDSPYSLFEGLAGNLLFLHHIRQEMKDVYFPCYTL
ncbi:unnamed protein product [Lepeophtheirus salmonis]|uniref:(salmon louse) hypothetical protein n=1 Tax=Lepeophtheirus salmonis TaxID=72036 RepID=A0A7R8CK14_LEPSM|nr:unnamed protein product [Lepeophtheirus salmonis]CAF2811154.1 unnamed protein product [Lepeophtheirus salmonis]